MIPRFQIALPIASILCTLALSAPETRAQATKTEGDLEAWMEGLEKSLAAGKPGQIYKIRDFGARAWAQLDELLDLYATGDDEQRATWLYHLNRFEAKHATGTVAPRLGKVWLEEIAREARPASSAIAALHARGDQAEALAPRLGSLLGKLEKPSLRHRAVHAYLKIVPSVQAAIPTLATLALELEADTAVAALRFVQASAGTNADARTLLQTMLRHRHEDVRRNALHALFQTQKLSDAQLELVCDFLDDEAASVRNAADMLLRRLRATESEVVRARVESTRRREGMPFMSLTTRTGARQELPPFSAVRRALRSPDAYTRSRAWQNLRSFDQVRQQREILAVLDDGPTAARQAAIRALQNLGRTMPRAAIPGLRAALEVRELREPAFRALCLLGPAAQSTVRALFAAKNERDRSLAWRMLIELHRRGLKSPDPALFGGARASFALFLDAHERSLQQLDAAKRSIVNKSMTPHLAMQARCLASFGKAGTDELEHKYLTDPRTSVRLLAASTLHAAGIDITEQISTWLASTRDRADALRLVAENHRLANERSRTLICALFEDPATRAKSLDAMRAIARDNRVRTRLRRAMRSTDRDLRLAALGQLFVSSRGVWPGLETMRELVRAESDALSHMVSAHILSLIRSRVPRDDALLRSITERHPDLLLQMPDDFLQRQGSTQLLVRSLQRALEEEASRPRSIRKTLDVRIPADRILELLESKRAFYSLLSSLKERRASNPIAVHAVVASYLSPAYKTLRSSNTLQLVRALKAHDHAGGSEALASLARFFAKEWKTFRPLRALEIALELDIDRARFCENFLAAAKARQGQFTYAWATASVLETLSRFGPAAAGFADRLAKIIRDDRKTVDVRAAALRTLAHVAPSDARLATLAADAIVASPKELRSAALVAIAQSDRSSLDKGLLARVRPTFADLPPRERRRVLRYVLQIDAQIALTKIASHDDQNALRRAVQMLEGEAARRIERVLQDAIEEQLASDAADAASADRLRGLLRVAVALPSAKNLEHYAALAQRVPKAHHAILEAFATSGGAALPHLADMIDSCEGKARLAILERVAKMRGKARELAPGLVRLLGSLDLEDDTQRADANAILRTLASIDADDFESCARLRGMNLAQLPAHHLVNRMLRSKSGRARENGFRLAAKIAEDLAIVRAAVIPHPNARTRAAASAYLEGFVRRNGVDEHKMNWIIPALVERSYDLDARVRRHAVQALKLVDRFDPRIETAIEDAKRDPDPRVRRAARGLR